MVRRTGDTAGLTAMAGTGGKSIWQKLQSSIHNCVYHLLPAHLLFWQVCGPAPYSKLFETTPNASHIFTLQHWIRKNLHFVAITETENEAAEKHEDEKLSRTVDWCLHKRTTEENKTQSSHWFSGSYSCNPARSMTGTNTTAPKCYPHCETFISSLMSPQPCFKRTTGQISLHCTCTKWSPAVHTENVCESWH